MRQTTLWTYKSWTRNNNTEPCNGFVSEWRHSGYGWQWSYGEWM